MSSPIRPPPPSDVAIGLEFYATEHPGVPGTLKATADDFHVREVSAYPRPAENGPFVVLRVESENWEQHELAAAIARRFGLAHHAIDWAGTKDRRAVSERLFSYRGALPVVDLDLPRARVVEAYRADEGVRLGHHFGNRFEIRVRALPEGGAAAMPSYLAVRDELRALGGLPNFFGPQRFGEVRPVTHDVGRALVRGDAAEAVEIYLAALPVSESTPVAPARVAYAANHDVAQALRDFPYEYRFERTLLEHLARGHSPERALRGLQRELRLLFVHAYQSLLFNRWLALRHRRGLSPTRPIAGDRILRIGRDGTVRGTDSVPVASDNLPECADLVERGRALLAAPLIGYETPVEEGPVGELLRTILGEEELELAAFRLPHFPELASAGTWRPAAIPVPPIDLAVDPGAPDAIWFRFALPKGAYATILLREFLKPAG